MGLLESLSFPATSFHARARGLLHAQKWGNLSALKRGCELQQKCHYK
jgi:hypothetical protein